MREYVQRVLSDLPPPHTTDNTSTKGNNGCLTRHQAQGHFHAQNAHPIPCRARLSSNRGRFPPHPSSHSFVQGKKSKLLSLVTKTAPRRHAFGLRAIVPPPKPSSAKKVFSYSESKASSIPTQTHTYTDTHHSPATTCPSSPQPPSPCCRWLWPRRGLDHVHSDPWRRRATWSPCRRPRR